MDMKNADSILIMGSNMAECHPVAFRWVMQAKTRLDNPCKVIHADPRFTRTSAMADLYARYSAIVYGVALRVLGDTAAAEDVLQEIFLQLWRKPQSFDAERGRLAPWLAVIARTLTAGARKLACCC